LRIIDAILAGERDPEQPASLCSTRIKASRQTVAEALHGNWEEALLFCLKTALEIYRFTQNKIQDCDKCVERRLAAFEITTTLPKATGNLRMQLHQVCGVDLTKIPGIKEQSAQIIISEVGLDMSRWNTEKQFSSFLGLCPNNLITGGKILRRNTRKVYNRAADTLRLCAEPDSQQKRVGSQVPPPASQTWRSKGNRSDGSPPGALGLPNVALRRKLRRKRYRALRTQIPTPAHQMAKKASSFT
jgi:transposase